jgi:hypothetical protein
MRKIEGPLVEDKYLPLLYVQVRLRQPTCLPCLPAPAVPINIGVAERSQAQRKITSVEVFCIRADCDYRLS